jgi:lysophospholipase L1-like esterase
MRGFVLVVFTVLAAGCVIGAFFAYKAFKLRAEVKAWKGYHDNVLARLNELQKDYAQVSAYADDNRRLMESTSVEDRREMTVLYGASITKSWDLDKAFPGKKLLNRGVSAQSDTQLLARFSSDVLQLTPGQVVIKFCSGNFQPGVDSKIIRDEFEMMALAAESHGIKPLLATIIPVTSAAEEFDDYSIGNEIRRFNKRIRDFARERGFAVVDYYGVMASDEGYLPDHMARDSIHPNEKGYEVMAAVLKPYLED